MQLTMKSTTQFLEKLLRSLSQQLFISELKLPFWVISVLNKHLFPSKIQTNFFLHCSIKASASKITPVKTKDSAIGNFPTQRPFEGFLLNSQDNIQTLHQTLW